MTFTGKDLIDFGYEPGPDFKKALKVINEQDMSVDDIHALMKSYADAKPKVIPLQEPAPCVYNISIDTDVERENFAKVKESMDALLATPTVLAAYIMPDACPAGPVGTIPVGGVVTTENAIHPGMHSADICCSLMASEFEGVGPKDLLNAIHSVTHFGPGGRSINDIVEPNIIIQKAFETNPFLSSDDVNYRMITHFATQGDGNHFAFVGTSENTGKTYLITHHGSRGVGAKLYKQGMRVAEDLRKKTSPDTLKQNAWIPYDTQAGQDYWKSLRLVRMWTRDSHRALHSMAANKLSAGISDQVFNEHNFVFREEVNGKTRFHHAKGATPLSPSILSEEPTNLRIVPLNMGSPVLIVGGDNNANNGGFGPHGAGRNMSRSAHARMQSESDDEVLRRETEGIDARFYNGKPDLSELPSAYKSSDKIEAEMSKFDLCEVVDRIMPYGSIMAGEIVW